MFGISGLRLLGRGAAAGLLSLGLATGALAAPMPKPLDPPQTVKVAYVPIMKFAALYVAASRGLFKKQGIKVDINRVRSGTEAIAFLTQGSIDVGGIAIVTSLWNGWHKGLDIRIIAPGALEPMKNSPTEVLVRKDLYAKGLTTMAGLKGKRVAISGGPGSGGEYLLSKALERAHLTIRDVDAVNLATPDMPAAFANKSIDAAILGSPFADQVLQAGTGTVLATDITPGLMTVAFVGSGKFVTERPEVAKRFVLAMMEATRLMQGDDYLSKPNIDAYLAYTNSTAGALKRGNPVIYDPDMVIPVKGLADVERVHRENGRTTYKTPVDIHKVVDERFTKDALAILGPYKAK